MLCHLEEEGKPTMKKVIILLTRYSDWISSFVYHIAGHGYTHASLGLEDEPETYYSFNYKGFCTETLEKHRCRGVENSMSCELEIPDEAYQNIRDSIAQFKARKADLRYTRLGVACCLLHLPIHWKNHYFCSQFVAELLQDSGAVELDRCATLYLPNHFCTELPRNCRCRLQLNPV